jgi:hypothetical protein
MLVVQLSRLDYSTYRRWKCMWRRPVAPASDSSAGKRVQRRCPSRCHRGGELCWQPTVCELEHADAPHAEPLERIEAVGDGGRRALPVRRSCPQVEAGTVRERAGHDCTLSSSVCVGGCETKSSLASVVSSWR